MGTRYYDVSGFDIPFFCKVSTLENPYKNYTKKTISFGGPGTFCITIAVINTLNGVAYIANVDYNEKCTKTHNLEQHKGTYRLVKTALWATRLLFPEITKFTLQDDSHIYCVKGSKEYKADLASDYIFKYNETWYEKNFGARLPESEYNAYKISLDTLDAPLHAIDKKEQSYLDEFKDIYYASSSPRNFINNMRATWKNAFCMKVGPWLHNYLMSLGIDIPNTHKSNWFIDVANIEEVPGFSIKEVEEPMYGGNRRQRRHITRKHRKLVTYTNNGCIMIGYPYPEVDGSASDDIKPTK